MENRETNIRILPPELANQIAAGEVVERPSSVLKELIENSLDAKATSITAMIEDGGQACIKVSDNGVGIPQEELQLAVTRHATSKIKNISELSTISSFGFRGEALPSIASVSRFRIASYFHNNKEDQAYALDVHYGEMKEIQPIPLRCGTQIEVRNLFNNIPARLKFLKTPSTEFKKAQEIFTRTALIQPSIAFDFFAGTREVLSFSLQDSIYQRLCKIWAPSITKDMLEVMTQYDEEISIEGFISDPRSLYSRGDKLLIYVNKRPVTDKMLVKAIRQAYQRSLTTKDYPQLLLNINIPPEEIDVNVHPAKSEVRFRDEKRIFKAVYSVLDKTLSQKLFFNQDVFKETQNFDAQTPYTYIKEVNPSQSEFSDFSERFNATIPKEDISSTYIESPHVKPAGFWGEVNAYGMKKQDFSDKNTEIIGSLEEGKTEKKNIYTNNIPLFLCQIASTYLLYKLPSNEVFILDQHAVHERVLFERLAKKQKIETQTLLLPLRLNLHPSEKEVFFEMQNTFEELGFNCTLSNENTLICDGIPPEFQQTSAENFIREALKNKNADISSKFMDAACDAALKANQNLTYTEAIELYQQWANCDEPDFCPHGRPCYILLERKILDKLFKRI